MSTLARLRSLGAGDWRIVAEAALLLPLVALQLRVLGLDRLLASRARGPRVGVAPSVAPQGVGVLVAAVSRRIPFGATCLTRSLVLDRLLRRRGIASALRIGVRVDRGRLDAHAWVECDGRPVNDSADVGQKYAAFAGALLPGAFAK